MKSFIVTFFLLAVYFQSFAQFEQLEFGTDSTLEVVTWNLEWFPKNGQTTINYVSQIIQAIDADIFAIQEIDNQMYFEQLVEDLNGWDGYWVESGYLALGYIYIEVIFLMRCQHLRFLLIRIVNFPDLHLFWK